MRLCEGTGLNKSDMKTTSLEGNVSLIQEQSACVCDRLDKVKVFKCRLCGGVGRCFDPVDGHQWSVVVFS